MMLSVGIDPVVNDLDTFRIDIKQSLDVTFGFGGDGNDRVRHFERGFLNPHRKIITAGELFALPWPQRFERVRRDHERNSVIQFRENAAEMAVPSVTMHQSGVDVGGVKIDAAAKRTEDRLQRLGTSEFAGVEVEPRDFEAALFGVLFAETTNIDIDRFRQLTREIINVDTGTAVNVRRIFIGKEADFHANKPIQLRLASDA
jgi:hypothetical protein